MQKHFDLNLTLEKNQNKRIDNLLPTTIRKVKSVSH